MLASSPGEGLIGITMMAALLFMAFPAFVVGLVTGVVCSMYFVDVSRWTGAGIGVLFGSSFGWAAAVLLWTLEQSSFFVSLAVGAGVGAVAVVVACWAADRLELVADP